MPIDLAAILIGILAIVVSVLAGMYAAGAIAGEYVVKITARLIALERKVDLLLGQQTKALTVSPGEDTVIVAGDAAGTPPPARQSDDTPSQ